MKGSSGSGWKLMEGDKSGYVRKQTSKQTSSLSTMHRVFSKRVSC